MLMWLAAVLATVWSPVLPFEPADELRSDVVNPSAVCGQCHEDIYAMWRRSMHASSYTDPIFAASYMQAYVETEGRARIICLRCHAPAAILKEGAALGASALEEGISCDYCHSIVSVDLERRERPFEIRIDGVKRGPIVGTESPAPMSTRPPKEWA
jgi:hypothetical protein